MGLKERVLTRYIPQHIAIIMDGNGRWAKKRNMPRTYGHKKGSENLKNIALACNDLGIKALSVYAFSTENWKRPKAEIDYLMGLPKEFEETFKGQFEEHDIKVMFSGRRDRFPKDVIELMNRVEDKTKDRQGLVLNICFDYGSHTEMIHAIRDISRQVKDGDITLDDIDVDLVTNHLYTKDLPPLDLLIRTSGEMRISNYLLWQLAYSELYFAKVHWPAFNQKQLLKAIDDFQSRNRRFGGLKEGK
ncbi:isoprenyl transferase [Candidatus Xianfuyuplasma coldseepsis]|uniref:Isoprenyl transferase n=1 Tax=Candidatus Xianfuyuplasma coldseepsis TaxID=2782163 RepID=A0A7L7KRJ6_9MOLU|nr:isoprenyl transferase [Xianfuyuplasma coldseepsis]QMS85450.1 isoprenyl transferase [Xianfuyuplasma coldseepsis]